MAAGGDDVERSRSFVGAKVDASEMLLVCSRTSKRCLDLEKEEYFKWNSWKVGKITLIIGTSRKGVQCFYWILTASSKPPHQYHIGWPIMHDTWRLWPDIGLLQKTQQEATMNQRKADIKTTMRQLVKLLLQTKAIDKYHTRVRGSKWQNM